MCENERDQVTLANIYQAQTSHVTNMTDRLFSMPVSFATVVGGAWVLAGTFAKESPEIAGLLFFFSFLCACAFSNVVFRFGKAYKCYLDNLNKIEGEWKVTIKEVKGPSTVNTIISLLIAAGIVSLGVSVYFGVQYFSDTSLQFVFEVSFGK